MILLIEVQPGGEGLEEDINYLKYHLAGRPDGEYDDCNLDPVKIKVFKVHNEDPLVVILECEDCDIDKYLGNIGDISYEYLE